MKFSKTLFALLCVFSVFCVQVAAQNTQAPAGTDSQAVVSDIPPESSFIIDDGTAAGTGNNGSASRSSSGVWLFFKMIFVLIAVAACIYFVMNFMKKKMAGTAEDDDTFLRRVASISLAPGKSVQIVTLLEHAYLLGVTDGSIDLLGEITDKELVDAMNLNADLKNKTSHPRNFSDLLNLFLNPKNADTEKKSPKSKMEDFFKAQRKKINGGE